MQIFVYLLCRSVCLFISSKCRKTSCNETCKHAIIKLMALFVLKEIRFLYVKPDHIQKWAIEQLVLSYHCGAALSAWSRGSWYPLLVRTMSFGWRRPVFTSLYSLKEVRPIFLEIMLTTGEQTIKGKEVSHFYTLETEPWQTRTQNTWGKTESGFCLVKAAGELLSSHRTAYAFCDTVIRLIS